MQLRRGPHNLFPPAPRLPWLTGGLVVAMLAACGVAPKDAAAPVEITRPRPPTGPVVSRAVTPPPEIATALEPEPASGTTSAGDTPASPPLVDDPHPDLVEVRKSNIPTAGYGLFARANISAGTHIGNYTGEYLTLKEVDALPDDQSTYLYEIPQCAVTNYDSIAGDPKHYVSKVNFAPSEINGVETNFQNVEWEESCTEPFVRLHALRDIRRGEELYVDYGEFYGYDFMNNPQVQRFFLRMIGASPKNGFVYEYSNGA